MLVKNLSLKGDSAVNAAAPPAAVNLPLPQAAAHHRVQNLAITAARNIDATPPANLSAVQAQNRQIREV